MERFKDRHNKCCDVRDIVFTLCPGGTTHFYSFQALSDHLVDIGKSFSDCDIYFVGGVLFVDCD